MERVETTAPLTAISVADAAARIRALVAAKSEVKEPFVQLALVAEALDEEARRQRKRLKKAAAVAVEEEDELEGKKRLKRLKKKHKKKRAED